MAMTIGEIEIRLTAAVGQFEAQMNRANKSITGFGRTAKTIGGMIAGAFAVRAVTNYAATVSRAADANAKHARSLGMSLEGLIELQHAGTLAGISIDQMSKNMDMMVKRIGQGGAASDALSKLGLSAEKIKNVGLDKGLNEITLALNRVQDPMKRAALATDMFGRTGMKMLQLTQRMNGEARELGLTMSDIDAKKLESVNDNFTRLAATMKGAMQSALVALAPKIEQITNMLVDAGKGFVALVKGGELTGGEMARTDAWGDYYRAVDRAISMERRGLIDLEERNRRVTEAVNKRVDAVNAAKPGFESVFNELSEELDEIAEKIENQFGLPDFAVERKKLEGLFELGKISDPAYRGALADLDKKDPAVQAANEFFSMIAEKAKAAYDDMSRRAETLRQTIKLPVEQFADQMADINELLTSGMITQTEAIRAEAKAREEAFGRDAATRGSNVLGGVGDVGAQAALSELRRRGEVRDKQEQQLLESRKQSQLLGQIANNTGASRIPVFA